MSLLVELTPLVGEVGLSSLVRLVSVICQGYLGYLFSSVWQGWDVFTNEWTLSFEASSL